MKLIIDLIEDIREEIGDREDFTIGAILLKDNPDNPKELLQVGQAQIDHFTLSIEKKQLIFSINNNDNPLHIGDLLKHIMILDMSSMMHEIRIYINSQYPDMEIIGFGKSLDTKQYMLIIKI